MQIKNHLKKRIKNKDTLIGTWSIIPSSTVMEIFALSGFDFIIIDHKHGPHNYESSENYIRAIENSNCTPLIRVSNNDPDKILRALEIGAHGIVVPNINNKLEASKAIESMKYFPEGKRGVSAYTRSTGYSPANKKFTRNFTNNNIISMLLLESAEALKNIDEILTVKNIDIIYFGTYDLSQSLGILDDLNNKKLISAIDNVVKKIINKNITVGVLIQSKKEYLFWKKKGLKFFLYQVDCGLIKDTITQNIKLLKK